MPAKRAIAADAAGLAVFVAVGVVAHGGSGMAGSGAVTLACLWACWLGLGRLLGAYTGGGRTRTIATWALAVPLAVLLRALLLGRSLNSHEGSFLAVALIFTAVFVALARLVAARLPRGAPSRA